MFDNLNQKSMKASLVKKDNKQIYQDLEGNSSISNEDNLSTEAALVLNMSESIEVESQNNRIKDDILNSHKNRSNILNDKTKQSYTLNKGSESPLTPANLLCPWESIQNNILRYDKIPSTEKRLKEPKLTKEVTNKVKTKEREPHESKAKKTIKINMQNSKSLAFYRQNEVHRPTEIIKDYMPIRPFESSPVNQYMFWNAAKEFRNKDLEIIEFNKSPIK